MEYKNRVEVITDKLREIYKATFEKECSTFNKETRMTSIGLDSLESFNFLFAIEQEYKIEFSSKFFPNTLGELVNEINRLMSIKEAALFESEYPAKFSDN